MPQRVQQRKYQSLGKILGSIAQDYNGILAKIEGHAHMMERQTENPDEGKGLGGRTPRFSGNALQNSSVQAIIAAVEQGSRLTRRLIQLSEFPADPAGRIDLVAAIRRNQVLLRPVLGSGAEIDIHMPDREIYIPLCEEGVTQIMISAVLDARSRHAGKIMLSVSLTSRRALLHITDNGIRNLPSQDLRAQNRPAQDQTAQDTMSAEWQMIDDWAQIGHGTMRSALYPSQGGDILLAFPLGIQSANPFADKTVLVVDNGEGLPDLVEDHLRDYNMRVLKAANAQQALVMQRQQQKIDILLTDPFMPELNGVKLAEMLLEDHPHMRVVYMTSDAAEEIEDQEMAEILKSAITTNKPFSLRGLSLSLERALQSVQDMDVPEADA